jgi:hypothetical protein
MFHNYLFRAAWKWIACVAVCLQIFSATAAPKKGEQHFLYAAMPGVRNYLEYGGHGILVFDIDHDHKFVKRIPSAGLDAQGKPLNVRGICANAATKRLYVSTIKTLQCFDLVEEKLLWEKNYEGGCDRMAMSPDGKIIYSPSDEAGHWNVVNALSGAVIQKIVLNSGAHNTIYGPNGREVYLAGLRSPLLAVADTKTHTVKRSVGPFANSIRPFTINSSQTLVFVNVNELLGFEVGDLVTGKKLHRVEVEGFKKGPVKRHGCPSHGIGMTPNEKEIWLTDSFNKQLHIYNATSMPPKQIADIAVRDEPGWITFSIDGRYAYPSTGDVIDVASRKFVAELTDETGTAVQSEKMVEIDFKGNKPVRAGNQFGIGAKR